MTTFQQSPPKSSSGYDDIAQLRGDFTMLRVTLLTVGLYVGLGLLGFAVFAGFWPPPSQDLDAAGISAYFREHELALRIGMVLMVVGAPCYYTWSVVVSKLVGRMEGPMGPLSSVELLGGLLTGIVTMVPAVVWLTASFRIEARSDETIQLLYDFGWLFFDLTFMCSLLQQVALGLAIVRDRRTEPLFPKWVAWLCFLTSVTYLPLVLVPFFRTGPFAWSGLLNFWAVFVMFFLMVIVVTVFSFKALKKLEVELTTQVTE